MFGLKKLFKRSSKKSSASVRLPYPPALLLNSNGQIINCNEIDRRFYGQMLGVNSFIEAELNGFEKKVLLETEKILNSPDELSRMLPRMPMVLPKLLKVLRDETTSADAIAELIGEDAVLVADVMRLTKTPFYRTRQKITSLKHAIVLLGREGIKRLTASAVMKPLLSARGGFFMQMSSKLLWQHADLTANSAYRLANDDEEARFHTYLAGLMQNLGFTVALKIMDRHFDSSEAPRSRLFMQDFEKNCRKITQQIARSWAMPRPVIEAYDSFDNNPATVRKLDFNLYIADRLARSIMVAERLELDLDNMRILLNDKACVICQKLLLLMASPEAENQEK